MADIRTTLVALYDADSFPIGILHAVLDRAGLPVTSVFFKRRDRDDNTMVPATSAEIDTLVDHLASERPDLVGLCVRSVHFQLAREITSRLRQRVDTRVVWGGIHPTLRPEQCLEHADVVCVGEGEEALPELVTRMSRGEPVEDIRNLWFRTSDGVVANEIRPLIEDLDSVPFPDYSSANKVFVDGRTVGPHRHRPEGFMSSRGCPFSCTFCCNHALRQVYAGHGRYVRRRSVDNVIAELVQVKAAHDLEVVTFWDDVFTFDAAWLEEFCAKYEPAVGLPFRCYCHPKATKEQPLRLLRDAGLVHVGMGIQSGSESFRHHYYERRDRDADIISALRVLRGLGISYHVDLLLDNPLEGEKERQETYELLLELPKPFFVNTHSLTHFPESKLTQVLLQRGLIGPDDVEDVQQKSYTRWNPHLDVRRDRENMFWANLYFLIGINAPRSWVERVRASSFWRRHPKAMTRLFRWLVHSPSGQRVAAWLTRPRAA